MAQEQEAKKSFVMIVDDEEDILAVFKKQLTRDGFSAHCFSNPEIAVEHFSYSPNECSLVISDVRMPRMNGFQLARKVKELNPSVKIVLISAFEINIEEFRTALPHAPVDGFLEKPISLKKLSDLVKQLAVPQKN